MSAIFCEKCGDSGFSGHGTGYDDVCSECGGQSAAAIDDPKLLRERCESLKAERDAARRSGRADGLREAVDSVRQRTNRSYASNYRESVSGWDEMADVLKELMAALLARAEEVERG